MKRVLFFTILLMAGCKKDHGTPKVPIKGVTSLHDNCPASLARSYANDKTVRDSTDNFVIFHQDVVAGGLWWEFYAVVNCDSSTIVIPLQRFHGINYDSVYGTGQIYDSMIILYYSEHLAIEGYDHWFDGARDTFRF